MPHTTDNQPSNLHIPLLQVHQSTSVDHDFSLEANWHKLPITSVPTSKTHIHNSVIKLFSNKYDFFTFNKTL